MNSYITAGLYFIITSVVVLISVTIFDLLTKYKLWEEIRKGNLSVAFSTGGIIMGVANIMRFAIAANDTLIQTLTWGGLGTAALLVVYLAFELSTPKLNVSEEIGKGNLAVGFLSFIYSIAFSFIIGASIS